MRRKISRVRRQAGILSTFWGYRSPALTGLRVAEIFPMRAKLALKDFAGLLCVPVN